MACLTAFILASTLLFSSIGSLAQGLTQVTDGTKIAKGTISADDQAILKSMFDLNYYRSNNPDLANLKDSELFKHFCENGIFEGRTCNAYFDPSAYASAYPALKAQFGNDIMAYFRHYATIGKNDPNFSITTLEACANAKITVTSLIDSSIVVTPEIYAISKAIGTSDYKVAKAAWIASQTGQPVEVEDEDGNVLVLAPPDADTAALMKAKGMTPIGVINYDNDYIGLYLVAGYTGFALYDYDYIEDVDFDDFAPDDYAPLLATPNYSIDGEYGTFRPEWSRLAYIEVGNDGNDENGNFMWVWANTYDYDFYEVPVIDSASYQTTGGTYIDTEENNHRSWGEYYDPAGTDATEYQAVASITDNDDGTVTVAIGCYNEEDSEFALVGEWVGSLPEPEVW